MTPAEELAQAADKLDVLADGMGEPSPLVKVAISTTPYIAAMNPLVGKALAKLLRVEAALATATGPGLAVDEAIELARLINGSAS